MLKLDLWLNIAAIVCVAWGAVGGYRTYEQELARAHSQMRARYETCAGRVYETHAYEAHRLQLLTLDCSETLDDDRWLPVLTPNLSHDAFVAGLGPALLGLGLSVLAFWVPRFLQAARVAKQRTEIVR
ncbi:MAG TPA: hypothetical protein VGF42_00100 [Caulobacteraceae bacterium]